MTPFSHILGVSDKPGMLHLGTSSKVWVMIEPVGFVSERGERIEPQFVDPVVFSETYRDLELAFS